MRFNRKVEKSSSNSSFISTSSNLQTKSRLRDNSPEKLSDRKIPTPNLQAREKLTKYGHNLHKIAISHHQTSMQTKLTIGQPRDKYEQEGDKVAAQLVNQINSPSQIAQKRETPEEEQEFSTKPLSESSQRQAVPQEQKKVYTESEGSTQVNVAAQLDHSIQPARFSGQELIVHELTPVVQQKGVSWKRDLKSEDKKSVNHKLKVVAKKPITTTSISASTHLPIQGFFKRVWKGVKKAAKKVGGWIKKGTQKVWSGVKKVGGWLKKAIFSLGRNVWSYISSLPKRFWRILVDGWKGVTGVLKWLGSGLKGLVKNGWNALKGVFNWLGSGLSGTLSWLKQGLVNGAKWAIDFVRNPSLDKLKEALLGSLKWVGKGVEGLAKWGWDGLVAAATWAKNGVIGLGKWLWKGFLGGAEWCGRLIIHFLEILGTPEALQFVWELFNQLRPLNSAEIGYSKQVHAPGLIPYGLVRVDEKSLLTKINGMRAFVSFNIIHYPGNSLSPETVVHELTHVAQYHKVGAVYMVEALHAQFVGEGYPYGDLSKAIKNGKRFSDFNREQQATICEDYYQAINGKSTTYGGSQSDLAHYVQQMNRGQF